MSSSLESGSFQKGLYALAPGRGEPPPHKQHDIEFSIPEITTSPLTGLPNVPTWGQLNKSTLGSRYSIADSDSDDEYNWLPMGSTKVQIPPAGASITTLPATLIWQTEIFYNNNLYLFCMCSNGHLIQVTPAGVQTDIWQTAQFSENGTLNGTINVTAINTTNLSVGMSVTGTNIPANTTIASIVTPGVSGAITISNSATGSGTVSLTFSTPLFTTSGTVDISVWQSSIILISDSAAQKLYSWNGSQLFIVFNSQPVQYITVFQNRVWGAINSTIWWTNIGTYNSLAGDSGSYLITDAQCSNPVNCLLDSPYGLFVSGTNWIKFFTNLQDVGTPAVLTFQQNTIEGQIGPMTKWSVVIIGSVIYFANTAGLWRLNGSTPDQISSGLLNQFFTNMNWANANLSASYAMINGIPCILYQGYYNGDANVAAGYRVFGFCIESEQFFSISQGTIAWISGAVSVVNTNQNPLVWACDGTHIVQMFAGTGTLNSQLNTKLWSFGSSLDLDAILGVAIELMAVGAVSVTVAYVNENNVPVTGVPLGTNPVTLTPGQLVWTNNRGQTIQFVNNSNIAINFVGGATPTYLLAQWDGMSGRPRRFGINITVNGAGCVLIGIIVSLQRTEAGRGA